MNKALKITLIVLGVLLVIAVNIAIGWFIYTKFFTHESEQQKAAKSATTTTSILAALQEKAQASDDWKPFNVAKSTVVTEDSYVYVKSDEYSSTLALQAEASLTIAQTSSAPYSQASVEALTKATTALLEANGYKKEELSTAGNTAATFSGPEIACSLTAMANASVATLLCTSNEIAKKQAQTVATLAELQSSDLKTGAYTIYKTESDNDAKYSVATLDIFTPAGTISHSPVYTQEAGEDWLFVDDARSSATGSTGGGKIMTTQKIDTLLADTTYGPLYLRLIGAVQN